VILYDVKRLIQKQVLFNLLVGRLANSFLVFFNFVVLVTVELVRLHVILFCCGIFCFFVLWLPLLTVHSSLHEVFKPVENKALRMTVDGPWYVPNTVLPRDLQIPTVTEEIQRYSSQYSARLSAHPMT
jgi:hypothetical protein